MKTHQWYVVVREGGQYWTGNGEDYTTELSRAKILTELEMEVSFCYKNEKFVPLPTIGDA